jgi:lipopolysaccharide transport system permease protein
MSELQHSIMSMESCPTVDDVQQELLCETAQVTRIRPARGWISLSLRELWDYRELLYFLIWRDIKVRYKQTVLGAAWAIIQPFFTMVVFSLFFGKLANMPSDQLPYPIFAYAALVPWTFFANAITQSSNSLVQNANLIKKVYFPRLAVPISSVLSGVVDFMLAFAVLLVMMLCYELSPAGNSSACLCYSCLPWSLPWELGCGCPR